jgi:hypothetical protein
MGPCDLHNQFVDQVFFAALDLVGTNNHIPGLANKFIVQEIAKALLSIAYEGAIRSAILHKKTKLFLTAMGCGVFRNEIEWVFDSIERCLPIIKKSGLHVYLNVFNADVVPKKLRPQLYTMVDETGGSIPDLLQEKFGLRKYSDLREGFNQ